MTEKCFNCGKDAKCETSINHTRYVFCGHRDCRLFLITLFREHLNEITPFGL